MEQKDKKRFAELLTILSEAAAVEISGLYREMYWDILKPYPLKQVEIAAKEILRTRKYSGIPKPADFIELLEPDVSAQAIEAARIAFNTLWVQGESYGFNNWEDPLIPVVIERLGGWISQANEVERICCLEGSQIQEGVWRKNFEAIYKPEAKRPGPKEVPKMIGRIPGYEETIKMIRGKKMGELTNGGAEVKKQIAGEVSKQG